MRIVKKLLGCMLLLAGLGVFLAPDIGSYLFDKANQEIITEFQQQTEDIVLSHQQEEEASPYDLLYYQMQAYNERIFLEKQENIRDAWSFTQNPFQIELEDDLIGYVEIPAMEVSVPLYVGATEENMARGAAVLGETSLPIGGSNTNCVVAGHRGYNGIPYFREIEKLGLGDEVIVTNPWERLTYEVTDIKVIEPNELDAVLIQEGKDMLTLVTCHPYRGHARYRYLVYCTRKPVETKDQEIEIEAVSQTEPEQETEIQPQTDFESSEPGIKRERILRLCGAVVIGVMLVVLLII